jgi:hypothetical protein
VGQVTSGPWTYIVENGGATITASTATGAVTIPSSLGGNAVKKVGGGYPPMFGFSNNSVTSVVIPNSVTSIGDSAFYACTALTNITIPFSVTSIGVYTFSGCTSLASIAIPSSVGSIGIWAFDGCTALTSITIPGSVTIVGMQAFRNCTRLATVYLPASFQATYTNFSLTASQVILYDSSNLGTLYSAGQQSVKDSPSSHNLYTATQYSNNYNSGYTNGRSVGQADVTNSPATYSLYTATQYNANFTAGENSILNSPNANGLYTTNQIHNLGLGGIVLHRNTNNQLVLNYQVLQSTDLQSWSPYQQTELVISNAPSDKMFLRVQAVGQ